MEKIVELVQRLFQEAVEVGVERMKVRKDSVWNITFVALRTHPAIGASTLSIVGATRSVMLTSTSLRAGNSPCVDRTWNRTVIAFPSGQTSTLT